MKISVIYYSETGCTEQAARWISAGAETVADTEVRLFNIRDEQDIDKEWLAESSAVIFGTPTYYANMCWQIKQLFDTGKEYPLEGKLGAAFATENSPFGGGGEMAVEAMLMHMMVYGMMVYSGGTRCGQPYIHIGPTVVHDELESRESLLKIFGSRIAEKAHQLFDK